jgi:hypothetical protein
MTDLDIPTFLLRPRVATTTRRLRAKKKTAWKVKTPANNRLPKAWRGAKTAFVVAYPPAFPAHFPCGYRQVLYLVGRKGTVRVREVVSGERRAATAKLTTREFERSVASSWKRGARP